jgi:S-disulfanyl-L-cysteine oxidoreductase SoxD
LNRIFEAHRRRGHRCLVAALIACALCAWGAPAPRMAARQKSTALDAVYTSEQASRGEDAYNQQCGTCHMADLSGGEYAPALNAALFEYRWTNKTVEDLFRKILTTMPEDNPGTLDNGTCAAIVAYILKANGFPAGVTPLDKDPAPLGKIRITKKP